MGKEDLSSLKRGIPVVVLGPNFHTYAMCPKMLFLVFLLSEIKEHPVQLWKPRTKPSHSFRSQMTVGKHKHSTTPIAWSHSLYQKVEGSVCANFAENNFTISTIPKPGDRNMQEGEAKRLSTRQKKNDFQIWLWLYWWSGLGSLILPKFSSVREIFATISHLEELCCA